MIKVTLEIDNDTAYPCSPIEFIRKYVLRDAKYIYDNHDKSHMPIHLHLPNGVALITEIKQD